MLLVNAALVFNPVAHFSRCAKVLGINISFNEALLTIPFSSSIWFRIFSMDGFSSDVIDRSTIFEASLILLFFSLVFIEAPVDPNNLLVIFSSSNSSVCSSIATRSLIALLKSIFSVMSFIMTAGMLACWIQNLATF